MLPNPNDDTPKRSAGRSSALPNGTGFVLTVMFSSALRGLEKYGDGGIIATKPYAASGSYIDRMSDYCASCIYNPKESVRENACPFTTLYWDFLSRNHKRLRKNPRMGLQFRNLDRKSDSDLNKIRKKADRLKSDLTLKTYL